MPVLQIAIVESYGHGVGENTAEGLDKFERKATKNGTVIAVIWPLFPDGYIRFFFWCYFHFFCKEFNDPEQLLL